MPSSRFPAPASQPPSAIVRRWFNLIVKSREDLALLTTLEQGKPLSDARGEIDYAASFVEFYAEEAKRPNVESVTSHLQNAEVEVWREGSRPGMEAFMGLGYVCRDWA